MTTKMLDRQTNSTMILIVSFDSNYYKKNSSNSVQQTPAKTCSIATTISQNRDTRSLTQMRRTCFNNWKWIHSNIICQLIIIRQSNILRLKIIGVHKRLLVRQKMCSFADTKKKISNRIEANMLLHLAKECENNLLRN